MTDSVTVFPAGYRLTDSSSGAPLSGAQIFFYDAGTTNLQTVYADQDLTVPLSSPVITDSMGYPTTTGSTKTLIYVGTASYKIVIKNSEGTTIAEHDNVKGAADVIDIGSLSVTSTTPVIPLSLDYTVVSADQNKVFAANPTNAPLGYLTVTLPSAVTVGTGWSIKVQHTGTSNQVVIATVSSQKLRTGSTDFDTSLVLSLSGEEVTLVSDGTGWRCVSYVSPNIKRAQGVLTITTRAATPSGSEARGDLGLISATPTGAWSSFAVGDIVQKTNSSWVKFTPPTDSGWIAFVKSENKNYQYRDSAWVDVTTDTPATTVFATQAEMETATSTTKIVNPSVLKNHPAVPKFWAHVSINQTTFAATVLASYNIANVEQINGTSNYLVTLTTPFSSANYAVIGTADNVGTSTTSNNIVLSVLRSTAKLAGSFAIRTEGGGGSTVYPTNFYICGYGDQ